MRTLCAQHVKKYCSPKSRGTGYGSALKQRKNRLAPQDPKVTIGCCHLARRFSISFLTRISDRRFTHASFAPKLNGHGPHRGRPIYPFSALKSPLLLYPFRYHDDVRKRWARASYVAEHYEIEARYELTDGSHSAAICHV